MNPDEPEAPRPADAARVGKLSVVGTPIGHLDDITLRALATLKGADLILAEDTRRTRTLLTRHGIGTPVRSLHAHSSERTVERYLESLLEGQHFALVTDAGMPLISDPGGELVTAARARNIAIESVPGPSAVLAALSVCGLPFDAFRFTGFAPRSGSKRKAWLGTLAADPAASVFFESPARLLATLEELSEWLAPSRRLAVCRELTKLHEEVARGTASELVQHFAAGVRGEVTVVVGSGEPRAPEATATDAAPEAQGPRIDALLNEGVSARDVARQLARELGRPRRELYAEVQARASARTNRSE